MQREDLVDLNAFVAVAEERSFTRAAARLGTSQSSLSHTLRRLETRLGVRLLTRTTRSVAPTEAGEELLATLLPAFDSIGAQLETLAELRVKPSGTIRITTSEHAATTVLWPVLTRFLPDLPDVHVELSVDSSLADRCINLRLLTSGGLYAWELEKAGRELRVRVEGQLAFTNVAMIAKAAEEGFGLGFVMEDQVSERVADGRLVRVLEDWCPPFAGYHLYYPSRRQPSAAFAALVEALRYRG